MPGGPHRLAHAFEWPKIMRWPPEQKHALSPSAGSTRTCGWTGLLAATLQMAGLLVARLLVASLLVVTMQVAWLISTMLMAVWMPVAWMLVPGL